MKRVSWLLAASLMSSLIACGSDEPTPPAVQDEADLPASAAQQIEALLDEKAARTPAQRKISSALLYKNSGRFDAVQAVVSKDPAKRITSLAEQDAQGRVLVDIQGDPIALGPEITTRGGQVVGTSTVHQSVRAWINLDRIEELAADARVHAIRPAFQATTNREDAPNAKFRAGSRAERLAAMQRARESWTAPASFAGPGVETATASAGPGSKLSQGVKAHGAERARKIYGATGAGVTVGVISDSDDYLEQSIATGDLPASTITIPGQNGRPGSGEGTAMMEIVHDMAPDANLVFATAFNSP